MSNEAKHQKKRLISYIEDCGQPNNFSCKEDYCVPCECFMSNTRWCKVYQYRQCKIRHEWNLVEKGIDVFAAFKEKFKKKQEQKIDTPKRHRGRK